jgi:hypothetical protein
MTALQLALPYWTTADIASDSRWRLAGVVGLTLATTGVRSAPSTSSEPAVQQMQAATAAPPCVAILAQPRKQAECQSWAAWSGSHGWLVTCLLATTRPLHSAAATCTASSTAGGWRLPVCRCMQLETPLSGPQGHTPVPLHQPHPCPSRLLHPAYDHTDPHIHTRTPSPPSDTIHTYSRRNHPA